MHEPQFDTENWGGFFVFDVCMIIDEYIRERGDFICRQQENTCSDTQIVMFIEHITMRSLNALPEKELIRIRYIPFVSYFSEFGNLCRSRDKYC